MKSENYWANRANQRMDDYILQSEETANEIAQAYYSASKRIENEMVRVVKGLGAISDDATALKYLRNPQSGSVIRNIKAAVNRMPDGPEKQEALTLISSPAYLFRMRRLQATIDNARKECNKLYKTELKETTAHLKSLYSDAFSHTIYDIDKGYNTLHTFSMFPASRVSKLLKSRWSGENYSSRIWDSTQDLADTLKEEMLIAFMTGASVSETSRRLAEKFQTSAYQARRLVRTESNFIANQAEQDAYKRLGIEEYKYIATLDTRTSTICQSLDGRVFNVEDGKAGVNLPPMHPNCRSTTIMYDADIPLRSRAARDENGKRITVPGDMTYKEWQEKYHPELVDKSGESGIMKVLKMAAPGQEPLDFSLYKVIDNPDAVAEVYQKILNELELDPKNIDLSGIRNAEVLGPFINRLISIKNETGLSFKAIKALELVAGDKLCLASYQPYADTLYISSTYFNNKNLTIDSLKLWSANNVLSKQAKNIVFLAEHEAAHIRIPDEILNSSEASNIWRKRKETCSSSFDICEYYADCVAIYRTNPKTNNSDVIKAINFLKEKGVKI